MLHEFLTKNRVEIIARTRAKVLARELPRATELELTNGVPLFLTQLSDTLRYPASSTAGSSKRGEMNRSAAMHGSDLLQEGFTVAQVVHDYGDICQAVTELALEQQAPITTEEFRTLNQCLDDAIAQAVTEYACQRENTISEAGTERVAFLAHELRNLLNTALLAFDILRAGKVGAKGTTSSVLGRSLLGLRHMIDHWLAEVRLDSPLPRRSERVPLPEFIEEVGSAATIEAKARDLQLTVAPVEDGVAVDADRPMLAAAVTNLMHNAFKFTRPMGHVSLRTRAKGDRVLIEVEDECGGLPEGRIEQLFLPFAQHSADRTGLGLGLSIARRAVNASGGDIRVQDLPGKGCVFVIDLPRQPPSKP